MSYSMLLLQLIPFIVWFIVMGAGVALYVMGSLGTYTVAKHRGLKHAWLAWIPIGNSYIFGALSDDVTALRGIIKKYRSRVLLPVLDGCAAVGFVLVFAVIVCGICSGCNRRTGGFDCAVYSDTVYGAVYFSG